MNSFQTSVEGTRAFQGCLKPIFQSDAKFQTDKFALDLALKQWQNATLKWPIRVCFTTLCDWLKLAPSSGNQSEVKLTIAICDSVARTRFPAIGASSILYLIRVLIVSLCCLHLIWLVSVIFLVWAGDPGHRMLSAPKTTVKNYFFRTEEVTWPNYFQQRVTSHTASGLFQNNSTDVSLIQCKDRWNEGFIYYWFVCVPKFMLSVRILS